MSLKMKTYPIAFVAAALVMFGLDSIWLANTADKLYRPLVGTSMLDSFRPGPALAFYILYVCGITIFAIRPALASRRWATAFAMGAMFGLVAYGTYDLTNQATLKVWSTIVTLVDMAWGSILSAASATAGYFAASLLKKSDAP